MTIWKTMAPLFVLASLSGCHQAHDVNVTGVARPRIDEDQVKFYLSPPLHFVVIGVVAATAHHPFPSHRASTLLQELAAGAAQVGANGVILESSLIRAPSTMITQEPYDADSLIDFIDQSESHTNGEAIFVYSGSEPPVNQEFGLPLPTKAPAAATVITGAAITSEEQPAGISYVSVVVTDTGNETQNLKIANRTCTALGKAAKRDKVQSDGSIRYLCMD